MNAKLRLTTETLRQLADHQIESLEGGYKTTDSRGLFACGSRWYDGCVRNFTLDTL